MKKKRESTFKERAEARVEISFCEFRIQNVERNRFWVRNGMTRISKFRLTMNLSIKTDRSRNFLNFEIPKRPKNWIQRTKIALNAFFWIKKRFADIITELLLVNIQRAIAVAEINVLL